MRTDSINSPDFLEGSRKPSGLDKLARRAMRSRLERFEYGSVTVVENGESETFGGNTADFPVTATIVVNDPRFYSETAFGGSIGAGEAFMHGYWSCSDLTALVRLLVVAQLLCPISATHCLVLTKSLTTRAVGCGFVLCLPSSLWS